MSDEVLAAGLTFDEVGVFVALLVLVDAWLKLLIEEMQPLMPISNELAFNNCLHPTQLGLLTFWQTLMMPADIFTIRSIILGSIVTLFNTDAITLNEFIL